MLGMHISTKQFAINITALQNKEKSVDLIVGIIDIHYNILVKTYKELCEYYITHNVYSQGGYDVLIIDVTIVKSFWDMLRSIAYSSIFGFDVINGPSVNTIESLGETIVIGLLTHPQLLEVDPNAFFIELELVNANKGQNNDSNI